VTTPQWRGSRLEQALDMGARVDQPRLAGPLRRRPAGVEPIGGGDRDQPDVAPVLRHQADRLDRLRRDGAGIGDDDLGVRPGLAHPVGAVDDARAQIGRHARFGCSSARVVSRR
jgi:hypothetical protein